uniref:Uncharacterized protein n=1 Tax=uncultured Desulfobacterium sp. TaxID=201089 RepID=E1Y9H5_9BACT|nr:unknown protein [uncultured Desulfobacterium sp.]
MKTYGKVQTKPLLIIKYKFCGISKISEMIMIRKYDRDKRKQYRKENFEANGHTNIKSG